MNLTEAISRAQEIHPTEQAHEEEGRKPKTDGCQIRAGISASLCLSVLAWVLVFLIPEKNSDDASHTFLRHSLAPTPSPALNISLPEHLHSFLPEHSVVVVRVQEDSPQIKAMEWLIQDVGYIPDLLNDQSRIKQRFSLATLCCATQGSNWTTNTHWCPTSIMNASGGLMVSFWPLVQSRRRNHPATPTLASTNAFGFPPTTSLETCQWKSLT